MKKLILRQVYLFCVLSMNILLVFYITAQAEDGWYKFMNTGTQSAGVENKVTSLASTPAGLFAHYQFENNFNDSAGDHHGINYGASFVDGIAGRALQFNGTSNYVKVDENAPVDFSNGFTISVLLKLTSKKTTPNEIFFKGTDIGLRILPYAYGQACFIAKPVASASKDRVFSKSIIEPGRWYRISGVYGKNDKGVLELKIYINGELEGQIETSGDINSKASPFYIGKLQTNYFYGIIDELKLWSKALTDAEVRQEFTSVTLANGELQVSMIGSLLASLRDKKSNLIIPQELWNIELSNSTQINSTSYHINNVEEDYDNKKIKIHYIRNDGTVPAFTIAVTVRLGGDASYWKIDVNNPTVDVSIAKVTFPNIKFKKPSENSFVFLPWRSGMLKKFAPFTLLEKTEILSYQPTSPGQTYYQTDLPFAINPMQYFAYYDNTSGVYFSTQDPTSTPKQYYVDITNESLHFKNSWYVENDTVLGNDFEMPSEFIIKTFPGDWFDAAKIYRNWASTAPWWRSNKTTPEWFKDVQFWVLTSYTGNQAEDTRRLDIIKKFRDEFGGAPIAVWLQGWSAVGTDESRYPDFLPAAGGFKKYVDDAENNNIKIVPYINARTWGTCSDEWRSAEAYATKYIEDGQLQPNLEKSQSTCYGSHNCRAVMDPKQSYWQNKIRSLSLDLTGRLNTSGVYFDEAANGRVVADYDPSHGHALGKGRWWVEGYNEMIDPLRLHDSIQGKKILIAESFDENQLNLYDAFLGRYFIYPNQVPAVAAVYSGQMQIYGRGYHLDDSRNSADILNLSYDEKNIILAQSFVYGEQIGWLYIHTTNQTQDPYPALYNPFVFQNDLLINIVRSRYKFKDIFFAGEMLRPLVAEGEEEIIPGYWSTRILTGTFKLGNRTIFIFVNPHGGPFAEANYDLNRFDYNFSNGSLLRVYRNGEKISEKIIGPDFKEISFVFPRGEPCLNVLSGHDVLIYEVTDNSYTNSAPRLADIGNKTVKVGLPLTFSVFATDPDGDNLDYSANPSLSLGASFDSDTHTFSWTPNSTQVGRYTITFSVSDDQGGTASKQANITVYNDNQNPVVGTISPVNNTSAAGQPVTFTTTYTDPDGWQDIQLVYFLINTSINGTNCFYGKYDRTENKLYLMNSYNNGWLGGFTPGSANIIDNYYAKLDCSKTTVSGSDKTLTVNWYIIFEPGFGSTESKNCYLYVKDTAGNYNGWQQKGTWKAELNHPPQVESLTPSYGSSPYNQTVTFTTTYSDLDGWQDIRLVSLLINSSVDWTNCFLGQYDRTTNKLYLRNYSGSVMLGGYAPGSANDIDNGYAILHCNQTIVKLLEDGKTLEVTWRVTFTPNFTGDKKTYLSINDIAGVWSGWSEKGSWTISQ